MKIRNIQIATWELIEPDNIDKNTGNIILRNSSLFQNFFRL